MRSRSRISRWPSARSDRPRRLPGQSFQYQLNTLGRLEQASQFEDIIVRANPDGSVVRIRDVARVELGSEEYDWDTKLNGKPTATIIVFQLAEANGLQIKAVVTENMNKLAKHFPDDMQWVMRYDTTLFITESIKEVIVTLLEAVALVVLVVFIFLQNFRAVLIPTIAVPVSLIGTFAFMKIFGFSINSLSMLGMVLAVALVVDDAIVVVENVMRKLEEGGQRDIKEITAEAVNEVRGPHRCYHAGAYGCLCAGSIYPRHDRDDQQAVRPDNCHGSGPLRFQLPDPEPGPVRGLAAAGIRQKQCFFSGLQ